MDGWVPRGGALPPGEGAFERFLTAAIAAIITIMFSWRLLDEMSDPTISDEEGRRRRALRYAAMSMSRSSAEPSCNPPQQAVSELDIDGDSDGDNRDPRDVGSSLPHTDSGYQSAWGGEDGGGCAGGGGGGVDTVSRSRGEDGSDSSRPNSADMMKRFTSLPPLYLPTGVVTALGPDHNDSDNNSPRGGEKEMEEEEVKPDNASSTLHHYECPPPPPPDHPDRSPLHAAVVATTTTTTADNSKQQVRARTTTISDDNDRDEEMWEEEDRDRPASFEDNDNDDDDDDDDDDRACVMIDWPPHDSDHLYNVSGDSDDVEPRELDSDEELYCCSLLEPIPEEDSDDLLSSSGDSDSHHHHHCHNNNTHALRSVTAQSSSSSLPPLALDRLRSVPPAQRQEEGDDEEEACLSDRQHQQQWWPQGAVVLQDVFHTTSLIPDRGRNSVSPPDADDSESDESVQTVINRGSVSSTDSSSQAGSSESSPLHRPTTCDTYPDYTRQQHGSVSGAVCDQFETDYGSYPENMEDMLDRMIEANHHPSLRTGEQRSRADTRDEVDYGEGDGYTERGKEADDREDTEDEDESNRTIDNNDTGDSSASPSQDRRALGLQIGGTDSNSTPGAQPATHDSIATTWAVSPQALDRVSQNSHSKNDSELSNTTQLAAVTADSNNVKCLPTQTLPKSGECAEEFLNERGSHPVISRPTGRPENADPEFSVDTSSDIESRLQPDPADMATSSRSVANAYAAPMSGAGTQSRSSVDSFLTEFEDEPFSRGSGPRDMSPGRRETERRRRGRDAGGRYSDQANSDITMKTKPDCKQSTRSVSPGPVVSQLHEEPYSRRKKNSQPESLVVEFEEEPFSRRPGRGGGERKPERNTQPGSFETDLDRPTQSYSSRQRDPEKTIKLPLDSKPRELESSKRYMTDLDAEPSSRRRRNRGGGRLDKTPPEDQSCVDNSVGDSRPKQDDFLVELDEESFTRRRGRDSGGRNVSSEEKPVLRSSLRAEIIHSPTGETDPRNINRKSDDEVLELEAEPSSKRRRRQKGRKEERQSTPMETDLDDGASTTRSDSVSDWDRDKENYPGSFARLEEAPFVRRAPARNAVPFHKSENDLDKIRKSDRGVYRRDDSSVSEGTPLSGGRREADLDRSYGRIKVTSSSVDSFLTELDEEPFSRRPGRRRRGGDSGSPERGQRDKRLSPPASSSELHAPSKLGKYPEEVKSSAEGVNPETYLIVDSPVITAPLPVSTPAKAAPESGGYTPDSRTVPDSQVVSTAMVPESPTLVFPTAVLLTQTNTRIMSTPQKSDSAVTLQGSPTLSVPAVLERGLKVVSPKDSAPPQPFAYPPQVTAPQPEDPFADASTSNAVEQTPKSYTFSRCESESTHSERKVYVVDTPTYPDFDSFINNVPYTSEGVGYTEDGTAIEFDEYSAFVKDLHRPNINAGLEGPTTKEVTPAAAALPRAISDECILSGNLASPPTTEMFEFPQDPHSTPHLPAVSSTLGQQNVLRDGESEEECCSEDVAESGESQLDKDKSSKPESSSGDVLDTSFDIDSSQAREKMETDFAFLGSGGDAVHDPGEEEMMDDHKRDSEGLHEEDRQDERVNKIEHRLVEEIVSETEHSANEQMPVSEDRISVTHSSLENRSIEQIPPSEDRISAKESSLENRSVEQIPLSEDRISVTQSSLENRSIEQIPPSEDRISVTQSSFENRSIEQIPPSEDRISVTQSSLENRSIEQIPPSEDRISVTQSSLENRSIEQIPSSEDRIPVKESSLENRSIEQIPPSEDRISVKESSLENRSMEQIPWSEDRISVKESSLENRSMEHIPRSEDRISVKESSMENRSTEHIPTYEDRVSTTDSSMEDRSSEQIDASEFDHNRIQRRLNESAPGLGLGYRLYGNADRSDDGYQTIQDRLNESAPGLGFEERLYGRNAEVGDRLGEQVHGFGFGGRPGQKIPRMSDSLNERLCALGFGDRIYGKTSASVDTLSNIGENERKVRDMILSERLRALGFGDRLQGRMTGLEQRTPEKFPSVEQRTPERYPSLEQRTPEKIPSIEQRPPEKVEAGEMTGERFEEDPEETCARRFEEVEERSDERFFEMEDKPVDREQLVRDRINERLIAMGLGHRIKGASWSANRSLESVPEVEHSERTPELKQVKDNQRGKQLPTVEDRLAQRGQSIRDRVNERLLAMGLGHKIQGAMMPPQDRHLERIPEVEYSDRMPGMEYSDRMPGMEYSEMVPGMDYGEIAPGMEYGEVAPGMEYRYGEMTPGMEYGEMAPGMEYRYGEMAPGMEYDERMSAMKDGFDDREQQTPDSLNEKLVKLGFGARIHGRLTEPEEFEIKPVSREQLVRDRVNERLIAMGLGHRIKKTVTEADASESVPDIKQSEKVPKIKQSERDPANEENESVPEVQYNESVPKLECSESVPKVEHGEMLPKVEHSERLPGIKLPGMRHSETVPVVEEKPHQRIPSTSADSLNERLRALGFGDKISGKTAVSKAVPPDVALGTEKRFDDREKKIRDQVLNERLRALGFGNLLLSKTAGSEDRKVGVGVEDKPPVSPGSGVEDSVLRRPVDVKVTLAKTNSAESKIVKDVAKHDEVCAPLAEADVDFSDENIHAEGKRHEINKISGNASDIVSGQIDAAGEIISAQTVAHTAQAPNETVEAFQTFQEIPKRVAPLQDNDPSFQHVDGHPPRPKPRTSFTRPTPMPRSKSVGDAIDMPCTQQTGLMGDDGMDVFQDDDSDTDSHPSLEDGEEDELEFWPRKTMQGSAMSDDKKPRSLKEIRRQQKSASRPMIAPFSLPDTIILPSRLKIQASRRQFLSSENLDSTPNPTLIDQFASHKLSQQQTKERRYKSPNKQMKSASSLSSQDQLEKLHYLMNYSRHSESSFDRSLVEHLHEGCILTPEGRRSILDKTLSIENLQVDLSQHLRRYGSVTSLVETDIDTGETLETSFFPETNLDIFDQIFQSHQPLQRSASMSDMVLDLQEEHVSTVDDMGYRGRSGGMSLPSQTHKSTGKGRFAHRKYQKSKSLCTLETNLDDVGEEGMEDSMRRVPSVHELRVTKSLQKLNVPDWFKQSSLSKSSTSLLKYGSNSTMNSFCFSPSLISSPCASTAPPAPNVVIKTRVVPPSNPRVIRSPTMFSTSPKPPPSQVKLPSQTLREKERNKNLMPIPIVPFAQIRAMFEKKTPGKEKDVVKAPEKKDLSELKAKETAPDVRSKVESPPKTVPSISNSEEESTSTQESIPVSAAKESPLSDKPPLPPQAQTRTLPAIVEDSIVIPTVSAPTSFQPPAADHRATNGVKDSVDSHVVVSGPTVSPTTETVVSPKPPSPPSKNSAVHVTVRPPESKPVSSTPAPPVAEKTPAVPSNTGKDNAVKSKAPAAAKDSRKDAQPKSPTKESNKTQSTFSPRRSLRQFFGRSKDKSSGSEKKSDLDSSLDSSFSSVDGVYDKEPRRLGGSSRNSSKRSANISASSSFDRRSSKDHDSSFSSIEGVSPTSETAAPRGSRDPLSSSFPASVGSRPGQHNSDRSGSGADRTHQPPFARVNSQEEPRQKGSAFSRLPEKSDPPKFQRRLPGQGTTFGRLPSTENGEHVQEPVSPSSSSEDSSAKAASEKKSVKETTV